MARKTAAVAGGVGTTMPVFAVEAGGGVVVDVDGNSLIDLGSGIAVTTIGNGAPRVVDAVREQVGAFTHTCFMITPYEGYVAVAEALNRLTPGDHEKRTALFNSGAEAVENAVKVARAYTKRQAVAVFDHAYHGRTNLTMAMTAKSMPYKSGFGPFSPEVYRAPLSYPFRDGEQVDGAAAAQRAIRTLEAQVGAGNLPEAGAPIISRWLQAGSFSTAANAQAFISRLNASGIRNAVVREGGRSPRPMFRVRVGPIDSALELDDMVERLRLAGVPDARLAHD